MAVKNKKDIIQRRERGGGYLANSSAALFLALINVMVFWWAGFLAGQESRAQAFVLYPGALLQGKVWCLITTGFLHSNGMHLGLNMLALLAFGYVVQKRLGFWKTIFLYLGALFFSNLFSTVVYGGLMHKNIAIIGASGAVMGLMGAAMLLEPFSITWEMLLPIPTMFKGWLFFYADLKGFLGGETDGVSHLAHLLGFASIAVLVYFLSEEDKQRMFGGLVVNIISFALVIWIKQKYFI